MAILILGLTGPGWSAGWEELGYSDDVFALAAAIGTAFRLNSGGIFCVSARHISGPLLAFADVSGKSGQNPAKEHGVSRHMLYISLRAAEAG